MAELLKIVSSAFRLFRDTPIAQIEVAQLERVTMLRNDTFSFQLLFRSPNVDRWTPMSVSVHCDGIPVAVYRVDYVGVTHGLDTMGQAGFARSTPGLFPSPLHPHKLSSKLKSTGTGLFFEVGEENNLSSDGSYSALWITLNPDGLQLPTGCKTIDFTLFELNDGKQLETASLAIDVLDAELQEQSLCYTNWFHVDCLCDYYKVKPYSRKFYRYFETFLDNMVRHRQNMIIMPAITPAFDTVVGGRRKNVQLVDIEKTENGYRFDFSRLKEFIAFCKNAGIRYFEHPPLFSQWGAKHAVSIYDAQGNELFGWNTSATDPEYTHFLNIYLQELLTLERELDCVGDFVFHISDEPRHNCVEDYRQAVNAVQDVLSSHMIIDALSDVAFFKEGAAKIPVVFISHAEDFTNICDNFWLYYTGEMVETEISNRMICFTSARTRVLGLQLWYYRAKGFLHWAYNYCYDYMSTGVYDPLSNPCGYKNYPGASFLAYYTRKGAIPSISEKLMCEAMDDVRALQTLESKIGRQAVIDLCETILGKKLSNALVPKEQDLVKLRFAINDAIGGM